MYNHYPTLAQRGLVIWVGPYGPPTGYIYFEVNLKKAHGKSNFVFQFYTLMMFSNDVNKLYMSQFIYSKKKTI